MPEPEPRARALSPEFLSVPCLPRAWAPSPSSNPEPQASSPKPHALSFEQPGDNLDRGRSLKFTKAGWGRMVASLEIYRAGWSMLPKTVEIYGGERGNLGRRARKFTAASAET